MKQYLRNPYVWIAGAFIIVFLGFLGVYPYLSLNADKTRMVYIYPGMSVEMLSDTLRAQYGERYGKCVEHVLEIENIEPEKRIGAYKISEGDSPLTVAHRLASGAQEPINFTFNNLRTKEQFAEKAGEKFLMSRDEMLSVLNNDYIVASMGCDTLSIVTVLMPDSYEFYWTVKPEKMLSELKKYHDKWWNSERVAKATALGLTPIEVTTLASIVEEETAKRDERGKVARLYLNRLSKGMMLQADPTVKFALGDFSLKRIGGSHLKVQSPYNTYINTGLPPSPIRLPEKSTIDAVLNAPSHNYIFMCAKEDFSGYHNFTITFAEHLMNARKYQAALNARGIK